MKTTRQPTRSAAVVALSTALLAACGGRDAAAPAPVAPAPAPEPTPVAEVQKATVRVSAYGAAGANVVKAQAGDVEVVLSHVADGEFAGTLAVLEGSYDVAVGAYADPESNGSLVVLGVTSTPSVVATLAQPAAVHAVLTIAGTPASTVKGVNLGQAVPVEGAWLPFHVEATNPDGSAAYVAWWSDCEIEWQYDVATLTSGSLRFQDSGDCHLSIWGFSGEVGWQELRLVVGVAPAAAAGGQ